MPPQFTVKKIGSDRFRVCGSIPGYGVGNLKATNQIRRVVHGKQEAERLRCDLQAQRDEALRKRRARGSRHGIQSGLSPEELASAAAAVQLIRGVQDSRSLLDLVKLGLNKSPAAISGDDGSVPTAASCDARSDFKDRSQAKPTPAIPTPELPPKELIEAAAKASEGGVIRVVRRDGNVWEIHNPILVDLETAATHLGCSVRTVQRKARTHGVGISREVGPRVNLRALVRSIALVAK